MPRLAGIPTLGSDLPRKALAWLVVSALLIGLVLRPEKLLPKGACSVRMVMAERVVRLPGAEPGIDCLAFFIVAFDAEAKLLRLRLDSDERLLLVALVGFCFIEPLVVLEERLEIVRLEKFIWPKFDFFPWRARASELVSPAIRIAKVQVSWVVGRVMVLSSLGFEKKLT